MKRILIPLAGEFVAPRFDLAPEVLIVSLGDDKKILEQRTLVMPRPSPEAICRLILTEKINFVVCCAIEEELHQYLEWKKLTIYDSVVGRVSTVIKYLQAGTMKSGLILIDKEEGIRKAKDYSKQSSGCGPWKSHEK